MRIAIDLTPVRPDGSAGGATGFAIELIKGFSAVQGVQVMVLCADWNIKLLKNSLPMGIQLCKMTGGIKITGIAPIDNFIDRLISKFRPRFALSKNKVDILYCPFGAPTYREKGIPTVSTILDIQHEYYPQFFTPEELSNRRRFYQDIVKKVEKVVCISDYTKMTFCEKYGYPLERAQTIYIAIQNRFTDEDERILDKLSIRGQKYIVFPANFWEHKNHKLLLNAFSMYTNGNRDMKLVLTGNPLDQTDYYYQLIEALKIDDLTVITGYVTNEELYSILKNAKGLIYPSLFEGFGIPIVEAMHIHKLIASSNLTSLPEIGCDGIFYFNPRKPDDILKGIQFLSENEMNSQIIEQYSLKLKEYEAEKMVSEYLKIFEEVIAQSRDSLFEEEVSGIYPDGWSGASIILQMKDRVGDSVKLKLCLPEFVKNSLRVTMDINGKSRKFVLKSGETINIGERIEHNEETIKIQLSRTWSPKDVMKSEDARKLGVMVEELLLISKDNQITDLKNCG